MPLAAAALALSISSSGCFLAAVGAAGAAGAGTVAYVRGVLQAELASPYTAVAKAGEDSVGQLQFLLVQETRDALVTKISARTADDKKVVITISREADNLTRVQIRVGLFGDQAISQAIIEKIKAAL